MKKIVAVVGLFVGVMVGLMGANAINPQNPTLNWECGISGGTSGITMNNAVLTTQEGVLTITNSSMTIASTHMTCIHTAE